MQWLYFFNQTLFRFYSYWNYLDDITELRTETTQFLIFYGKVVVLYHFLNIFA